MTDHRIYTFLKLCELMNYRKTAEALNMTQPAVTQHIHVLEQEYGCRLFLYENRVLTKTPAAARLEKYAVSLLYNDKIFRENLLLPSPRRFSIGATKTIGEYTVARDLLALSTRSDLSLELIIDNTENLLTRLNALQLDFLLVEGYIDKNSYGHRLIRREELVGICSSKHPFAAKKEVPVEELLKEHIYIRESGSGTRAVFENFLRENGYSTDSFSRTSTISSFKLIEQAVSAGCGISFVYESIPASSPDLSSFRIKGSRIFHEFNYVYLKDTPTEKNLDQVISDYFPSLSQLPLSDPLV